MNGLAEEMYRLGVSNGYMTACVLFMFLFFVMILSQNIKYQRFLRETKQCDAFEQHARNHSLKKKMVME